MIGTKLHDGQGLGNAIFCYVATRCVAKKQNTEFAVFGKERLSGIAGKGNGLYFMDLDFGIEGVSEEDFERVYNEKEDRLFLGNSKHDCKHGCYITGVDEHFMEVEDGTLLHGNMQAEEYLLPYKEDIKEWLKVKPEYDTYEFCKDNLCVINIRGGEYRGSPELYVNKKYWKHGMEYMKSIRPDMEFVIVTDDVEGANKILPGIPAYHGTLDQDYIRVKNAKYLLLSNSSFAFFPAFTSETVQEIVAPKYWARHNVSDGYWASEQNIYTGWKYLDRKGKVFSAEECRKELEAYKKKSLKYKRINKKPGEFVLSLMRLESNILYYWSYAKRIYPAIMRRLKKEM
ncbi:MAG: glycosyl transferase [Lachnospiraceae bacterium]|nr:glycosyl transferase [Lachnospiraceae bacterium]